MLRRYALAAALASLPAVALAHHGWGSFDRQKMLDLTAPVERSTYANPHGTVHMRRGQADLTVELAPVFRMEARGLRAEDIAPGKTVRVYAYQNTSDATLFRAEWIEVDGRRVELR